MRQKTPVRMFMAEERDYTRPIAIFDAYMHGSEESSIDTPTYPIDDDFDTQTSTMNKQVKLQMEFFLTPYPVTHQSLLQGRNVEEVKAVLAEIYQKHDTLNIVTSETTYTDMALRSISFKRSPETGDAYEVSASFVQVHRPERYEVMVIDNDNIVDNIENGLNLDVEALTDYQFDWNDYAQTYVPTVGPPNGW